MRKKILQLLLILVAFCQVQTYAQTSKVTGRVVGPDNKPVSGASVTVSGSTQGTITDDNGNFSITVPSGASLLVNSVGFTDQTIKVDGRSVINVSLVEGQASTLNEVIVTGYSVQRKKDITGAVAVVDVAALRAVPSNSAASALQGQAAGVNVINTGSPGAASSIKVRGVTSFGSNQPLVLIDGIQGNLLDVPANDVESMQVLKDASASIYGARGANGVIIITTKRGKSGAPSVVYDSYYNIQIPRNLDKLDLMNTAEWVATYSGNNLGTPNGPFEGGNIPDYFYRLPGGNKGWANEGAQEVDPAKYNLINFNRANNSYLITKLSAKGEMYDELVNSALMMQHNVTASGGNDRATYLLSMGYLDHQGTVVNSYLKRYNVRINSTYKVRNNIRLGQNLNILYKNNIGNPAQGDLSQGGTIPVNGAFGPIEMSIKSPPFIPVRDIAGNWAGPNGGNNDDVGDYGNAVANATERSSNRARNYSMIGNAFLEIDFLKNFTARTSVGGEISNFYDQTYSPSKYWERGAGSEDELAERSGFRSFLQWTNTLNYRNTFGLHNLNVLVGSEAYQDNARNLTGRGVKFLDTDYRFLVLQSGSNVGNDRKQPRTNVAETSMFSLFGRLDYAYNDKYLLGVTVRRDGFSEFGENNQFGVFPAVSVGWRISQESFMNNVSWVNDLKLRASYGEMGNKENVRAGNAYTQFGIDPARSYYPIDGTNSLATGYFQRTYSNASTSWETNKMFNIGFDATLFANKLDLSVEYYNKSIEGMLYQVGLPLILGEPTSPTVNFGDMTNKGVDIAATYRASLSRDLNLTVGANFTTYKNNMVAMPEPGFYREGLYYFQPGFPISSFYGYKVVGLFRDQKDLDAIDQPEEALGMYRYADIDGDGAITPDDRTIIGDPNPDFTLGLNIGLSYKNFDFQSTFYGAFGQDNMNNMANFLQTWGTGLPGAKSRKTLDAWSPENPDGQVRKIESGTGFSRGNMNDMYISQWVEDASFFRMRNLQIGYTFEGSGLKKIGLNRVRAYVGATNLFVITGYSGLDPEVAEGGVANRGNDTGAYVPDRGVVLGLNVNF